jgi:hypothetical protein
MSDDDNVPDPFATSSSPPLPREEKRTEHKKKRKPDDGEPSSSSSKGGGQKKQKQFHVVKDWTMVVRPEGRAPDDSVPQDNPVLPPPPVAAVVPPPPPPPEPKSCSLTDEWDWKEDERKDRQKEQEWRDEREAAIAEGTIPERHVHDALASIGVQYVPEQDPMMDNDDDRKQHEPGEWLPLKCFFCEYGIMDQHSDEIQRLTNKFIEDVRTADEKVVCKAVTKHIHKEYGRIERFQTPPWMIKKHFTHDGDYPEYIDIIQNKAMNAVLVEFVPVLGVRMEPDKRPEINERVLPKFLNVVKERNAVIRTRTSAGRASASGAMMMKG